jgi:hypothetical protein
MHWKSNDARVVLLRVADDAGFVDFFAGQADVGGGRLCKLPVRNARPRQIAAGQVFVIGMTSAG